MTDHKELIAHLTRLGNLNAFLNPVPSPNPNQLALSRIVPPTTIHSQRHITKAHLRSMQLEPETRTFPICAALEEIDAEEDLCAS